MLPSYSLNQCSPAPRSRPLRPTDTSHQDGAGPPFAVAAISQHCFFHLLSVPVVLLVVATSRLPYGYYTFTRIVTCGIAGIIAFAGFRDRAVIQAWSVLLALVAVLFNPFVPIHLDRHTWFYLDLGAAAVFVAHLNFRALEFNSTIAPSIVAVPISRTSCSLARPAPPRPPLYFAQA
jgi:hypothetical protein